MPYALGIDLGGTHLKAVAVTEEGELLRRAMDPTEEDRIAWAARIRAFMSTLEDAQGEPAAWVGIAAPGLAARDGRSIAWMQGRLDSVQGLDWTDALASPRLVPVLNDAHAALLGEAWKGAAAGCRDVVLLTLGTGVGGGALVDGRLLKGHIGRGGHLGHLSLDPDGPPDITGTPGSLEDAIGECTLAARSEGRFASTRDLVEAVVGGDDRAKEVWLRSIQCLACGIVSIVNILDPEVVILGGGIANAGPDLFEPLAGCLDAWEWRPTGGRVRLVPAALGEWAGAYGAAFHAMDMNPDESMDSDRNLDVNRKSSP